MIAFLGSGRAQGKARDGETRVSNKDSWKWKPSAEVYEDKVRERDSKKETTKDMSNISLFRIP